MQLPGSATLTNSDLELWILKVIQIKMVSSVSL